MKTRIISALIGIPLLTILLINYQTIAFTIAISLVCMIGVYEFLHSTKYVTNIYILAISMIFAGMVPFLQLSLFDGKLYLLVFIYFALLAIALFKHHQTLPFSEFGISVAVSVLLPAAMSALVFLRDNHGEDGLYYIVMVFLCAWGSDIGAYFTGRFLGKHKLAPTISPKKTTEGVVGGVLFCIILNSAYTFLYTSQATQNIQVNLVMFFIVCALGSIVGVFGDLFASIVKRQTGIKDFGHLIPGHGGIIDRFDSVLFIAPFIYVFTQLFPLIETIAS